MKSKPSPLSPLVPLMAAAAGVHIASALTLDRRMQYKELSYSSPKLPPALDGYRIAFLTDIHDYPLEGVGNIVRHINRHRVDLLLLGGDFTESRTLCRYLGILSEVNASDGCFGVPGNHDSPSRLGAAMEACGMTLLRNQGLLLHRGFYLAGVEDLKTRRPSVKAALRNTHEDDFVLLLSHNPDVAALQDLSQADLTLCGHTHGGEATLFGLFAPMANYVSQYGHTYLSGWAKSKAGTDVYISRGVGCHLFRVMARPQVVYLTLRSPR